MWWIVGIIGMVVFVVALAAALVLCLAARKGDRMSDKAIFWSKMESYLSDEMKRKSAKGEQ